MLEERKILAEVTNCRQLFEFLCSSQKQRGGGHYLFAPPEINLAIYVYIFFLNVWPAKLFCNF